MGAQGRDGLQQLSVLKPDLRSGSLVAHEGAMAAADHGDYLNAMLLEVECLSRIVNEDAAKSIEQRRIRTILITAKSLMWLSLKAWKQREGKL